MYKYIINRLTKGNPYIPMSEMTMMLWIEYGEGGGSLKRMKSLQTALKYSGPPHPPL